MKLREFYANKEDAQFLSHTKKQTRLTSLSKTKYSSKQNLEGKEERVTDYCYLLQKIISQLTDTHMQARSTSIIN